MELGAAIADRQREEEEGTEISKGSFERASTTETMVGEIG